MLWGSSPLLCNNRVVIRSGILAMMSQGSARRSLSHGNLITIGDNPQSPPINGIVIYKDGEDKSKLLLAFCGSGICFCYLFYGMVQEYMYKFESPSTGQKMNFTLFLLLMQVRVGNWFILDWSAVSWYLCDFYFQTAVNAIAARIGIDMVQYWEQYKTQKEFTGRFSLKKKQSDLVLSTSGSANRINYPLLVLSTYLGPHWGSRSLSLSPSHILSLFQIQLLFYSVVYLLGSHGNIEWSLEICVLSNPIVGQIV